MLRYVSKKQIKILVSKVLYRILSLLAYIIAIEELFSESLGTCDKMRDFCVKPSSPCKTFLGILDPNIPRFVDSVFEHIKFLSTEIILRKNKQETA